VDIANDPLNDGASIGHGRLDRSHHEHRFLGSRPPVTMEIRSDEKLFGSMGSKFEPEYVAPFP
jgi:hypothetical protein